MDMDFTWIVAAMKCAQADLEGMVQREDAGVPTSEDDLQAARRTVLELASAIEYVEGL